jgi:CBS domain-containing protein
MERHRVGAVPIVDEATRTLIGTLSESDLTHLRGGASFAALALPVAEFLLHAHKLSVSTPAQQSGGLYNPNTSAFAAALMRHRERLVVSCRPSDTLTDVLTKMDVNAVHRVWVVDDAGVPTGVIALADVLAVIAQMGMSTEEVAKQRDKMVVA